MAIVFKNPMPSAGALFVSNPRKRRNAGKRKRRSNGAITRTRRVIRYAQEMARPENQRSEETKAAHKIVSAISNPRTRKSMRRRRNKGEVVNYTHAQIVAIDKAMRDDTVVQARREDRASEGYWDSLGEGQGYSKAEVKAVASALSQKVSTQRTPKGKGKAREYVKGVAQFGPDKEVYKSLYTKLLEDAKAKKPRYATRKAPKARKAKAKGLTRPTSTPFSRAKSSGTTQRRQTQMDHAMKRGKVSNPRNPWFGSKGPAGGHAGAAYIRWKKTAKGKKLLAAYHKSKLSGKGKKVRAKKGDKMKMFAIVAREYAGRRYKSQANRMKAIWREVDKRMAGKKVSKKRPSSARKKAVSKGKANKWIAFMKKMGSRGLTMTQLKRLYRKPKAQQQLAMQKLKKMRKRKGESSAAAKKRYQKRARGMVRQRGKRQPQMGPWMLKLNPRRRNGAVSWTMGKVNSAKMMVGKFPVVGDVIAPLVAPMAVGLGLAKAHEYLEPIMVPAVKGVLERVSALPLVGGVAGLMATKTVTHPYLITGIAVSWIGVAVHKYAPSLLSKNGAAMLGTSAVAVGVAMDAMLKPFAKAAAEVTVEATVAAVSGEQALDGFGDGGAYLIGAPTSALGPASFGAIGMDSSQMGGAFGALASEYSDANMLDAHQTPADFHPDEVAAIMSGPQHFQEKFGVSPTRLRKTIHDYSRHAGRPGHRFGWAIKMIGFHNVQKIAALPPHQRHYVLRQLKKQAIEAAPKLIAQAQQRDLGAIETASLDLNGSFNGSGGAFGSSYGALMFAGNNY
jgi:hypothetical protein